MISVITFLTKITIIALTFSGKTNNVQRVPNGQCNFIISRNTVTLVTRCNASQHLSTIRNLAASTLMSELIRPHET